MYRQEFTNYNDKQEYIKQIKKENNINYGFILGSNKFTLSGDDIYEFLEDKLNQLGEKYKVYTSKKIDNTNSEHKILSSTNLNFAS